MEIYHRYFVQYMLKNGTVAVNNAINYCRHVSKGRIDNVTHLKTLIIEINREISKQFFKIVLSVCEVTDRNLVVWLNTKNDDISKHQISFSSIELEYFHAILQEILNSEEHRITFIVCINIASTLTSQFTRDSGQKVLNKWLKGGYYVKRGDYIHLGPRTILEFTSYLRSSYPDSICNLCSEIVFTGKKCSHCQKILHSHCMSTYLSNQSICPCCHNDWIHIPEEDRDELINTNDHDSEMMSADETSGLNSYSQAGNVSTVFEPSSSIRSSQRSWSNTEYTNDINEPGPSRKKRHKQLKLNKMRETISTNNSHSFINR